MDLLPSVDFLHLDDLSANADFSHLSDEGQRLEVDMWRHASLIDVNQRAIMITGGDGDVQVRFAGGDAPRAVQLVQVMEILPRVQAGVIHF